MYCCQWYHLCKFIVLSTCYYPYLLPHGLPLSRDQLINHLASPCLAQKSGILKISFPRRPFSRSFTHNPLHSKTGIYLFILHGDKDAHLSLPGEEGDSGWRRSTAAAVAARTSWWHVGVHGSCRVVGVARLVTQQRRWRSHCRHTPTVTHGSLRQSLRRWAGRGHDRLLVTTTHTLMLSCTVNCHNHNHTTTVCSQLTDVKQQMLHAQTRKLEVLFICSV